MSSLVVPEPPSQTADMETWISAGLSISGYCRNSISGRISTSGIAAELRPPCVRDLKTMEEVGSMPFTSLERVTTGVRSVSRTAHIEADSHGRLLRPTIPDDVVSMIFLRRLLLTWLRIDANSYQNHDLTASKVLRKFYVQNVREYEVKFFIRLITPKR